MLAAGGMPRRPVAAHSSVTRILLLMEEQITPDHVQTGWDSCHPDRLRAALKAGQFSMESRSWTRTASAAAGGACAWPSAAPAGATSSQRRLHRIPLASSALPKGELTVPRQR